LAQAVKHKSILQLLNLPTMAPKRVVANWKRNLERKTEMCLAVPGQVKTIFEEHGTRMGKVNFGGVVKEVCLAYLPEIEVGDYTIVHVGFAISQIDEASAQETLHLIIYL